MIISLHTKLTRRAPIQQGWVMHLTLLSAALLSPLAANGAEFDAEEIEFFESKIRPVLAQECYECHNSRDKAKGGLALDFRDGLLNGGDLGPTIIPGKPDESVLMEALRHEYDLEMPKAGVKLDPPIVADFEKWIAMGAADPRDKPPTDEELASDTGWDAILETRKNWWSFQPIQKSDDEKSVDHFINERLEETDLKAASPAPPGTVARRLYFALTGLPPSAEELDLFEKTAAEDPQAALNNLTETLLASPAYGERWARHWMDWIRYAESHGSEGDPRINNAHLYRDYLIRSLNSDVPYDQLLKEHVAGDLLTAPRYNDELAINESAIATAHWRMVFHGFAPTDALDEKVRFTDDQINVFTKAFQGLTVSCARCHNHKFDAISQADYYALFGVFGSTRPGRKLIDKPEALELNKKALTGLKETIRESLYSDWKSALTKVKLPDALKKHENDFAAFTKTWEADLARRTSWKDKDVAARWKLSDESEYDSWFKYGNGLPDKMSKAGEFTIASSGDNVVSQIFPAGVYSNLISDKHAARLTSSDFTLDNEYELLVRARGDGSAMVRYVVQNYPRKGTVFKVVELGQKNDTSWKWLPFDVAYWEGDQIHIELATAKDAPLLTKDIDRSWFGVREAILVKKGDTKEFLAPTLEHLDPLMKAKGDTLLARLNFALARSLENWKARSLTDSEALFLEWALTENIIPNKKAKLPKTAPLATTYRNLESEIKAPTRVHGLDEWTGVDQPLYDRGDHKKPLEAVPRRFLDAIDPSPYQSSQSGRLELADNLLDAKNPFTRRVIVNRVWHHLFGQGLVPTPDNFGRMGDKPSHPELLDSLAVKFSDEFDWSLKKLITYLVSTEAFYRSSNPPEGAIEKDPDNLLLSHFTVKRLEAEAVRDALLKVSGTLDNSHFGTPVNGNTPRRSVYVNVIRNKMDPFLGVYDAPVPFSTTGRRSETNVPAQSLTMLNSEFVINAADKFASSTKSEAVNDQIKEMWRTALGREITESESAAAESFLEQMEKQSSAIESSRNELEKQLAPLIKERQAILDRARTALEGPATKEKKNAKNKVPAFDAIGHWDFSEGLKDLAGGNDLELVGSAKIEEGALILDKKGYARTAPLPRALSAKTLHARVMLSNLEQKGGGVMTIQQLGGTPFDSIVFAEKANGRWLSGSNSHKRTKIFSGTDETEASTSVVTITITYKENGTIQGYRNGVPYGKPYNAGSVLKLEKDQSQILFGLRHGNGTGGNRMLEGRIFEASLFDRALSSGEVKAIADGNVQFISQRKILDSLTETQRTRVKELKDQTVQLRDQLDEIGPPIPEGARWKNLAHSIFNLKEFIYVY